MLNDKTWLTIEHKPISNLLEVVRGEMGKPGEREVHLGTDSQQYGKETEFITVLTLLEKGKGGRAFYTREKTPRIRSLRERLMREVWLSVNLGLELEQFVPSDVEMTIHIDANPNIKFKSSNHVRELMGMVAGQGFKLLVKPDSWCASHAADHVVKHKLIANEHRRHH